MLICENHKLKIYDNRIVKFVSKHSMWIYLWHVLVLTIYSKLVLPDIWVIRLIVVYLFSVVIVIIVNMLLDAIEKSKMYVMLKYLRG